MDQASNPIDPYRANAHAKRSFAKTPIGKHQATKGVKVVYYLLMSEGVVKIGTSSNLLTRIRHLRTGPRAVDRILAVEFGSYGLETLRHRQFAHLRIEGELFKLTPELQGHIDALREALGLSA